MCILILWTLKSCLSLPGEGWIHTNMDDAAVDVMYVGM